jgi:hypothetical protein
METYKFNVDFDGICLTPCPFNEIGWIKTFIGSISCQHCYYMAECNHNENTVKCVKDELKKTVQQWHEH